MKELLLKGAEQMGVAMSAEQAQAFCEYHRMLVSANKTMNLTRISDDPAEAVDRNYLDSIAPLKYPLPEGTKTLVDVGSGAGFPGIPLSILLPQVQVTLIDSLEKRVKFLESVIRELGLNARAMHLRAEIAGKEIALREQFDLATSRAVASMNLLCEFTLPLVRVGGTMIAYKGPAWEEELAAAQRALEKLGGRYVRTLPAPVPGRDWNHTLIYVEKAAPPPAAYPRRPGVPEKKPL